ncbi:Protein of unknown function [Bacillus cytotoxicus]|nr:Protein of unknown function [Bacillus cytotoxicus]
MIANIPQ